MCPIYKFTSHDCLLEGRGCWLHIKNPQAIRLFQKSLTSAFSFFARIRLERNIRISVKIIKQCLLPEYCLPRKPNRSTYEFLCYSIVYRIAYLPFQNNHDHIQIFSPNLDLLVVNHHNFYCRDILVCLESIVSGHKINLIRPRLEDKMEIIRFDPWSEFSTFIKNLFLLIELEIKCIFIEKA